MNDILIIFINGEVLDGETTTEKDYEEFKAQLQKIDGTLVSVAEDLSYLDVTALEGNYDIIK